MVPFFGLVLALLFCHCENQSCQKFYIPCRPSFVSFLKGTPIFSATHVDLLRNSFGFESSQSAMGVLVSISMRFQAAAFAIVAFAFNEAAYASETIRAAILSVNPGEIEAARSLGMTRAQVYRRVIIPNAAVVATPTLINSLIGLTKGTSLAFSAGVVEVFAQAQILGGADYRYFERFISVALVYWVVNIVIESLGRFIERKMAISAPDTVQTDVKGDLR